MATPLTLFSFVSANVAFGTLVVSGLNHTLRHQAFRDTLHIQGVFPTAVARCVGLGLPLLELSLGLFGILAISRPQASELIIPASGSTALLYTTFLIYSLYLLRHRTGAPCGCGSTIEVITHWVPLRAGVLTLAALCGSMASADRYPVAAPDSITFLVSILASIALGVIVWQFPASQTNTHRISA